jgi:hypothetical protein
MATAPATMAMAPPTAATSSFLQAVVPMAIDKATVVKTANFIHRDILLAFTSDFDVVFSISEISLVQNSFERASALKIQW